MCRFLLVKAKNDINPKSLLKQFADMCKSSRTEEGDWQGDGWGVAWLNKKGKWQITKSLSPIWEEREKFANIPESKMLVVHARSASFNEHKGSINYNEPYLGGDYCYVFNGMLKGVRLKAEGKIGAQKVWSLLQNEMVTKSPLQALEYINATLKKHSREIKGLNIGFASKNNLFALCSKHGFGEYFTLRKLDSDDIQIVCSEEIGNYNFEKMKEGEVVAL